MASFMLWLVFVIVLWPFNALSSDILLVVPPKIKFAGVQLKFTRAARKRLQDKVNQLTKSKKSFHTIIERTNLFFPFIEKILAAEHVPEDFKFQAVHESMLIGDVVSHTHDVGFWQIHKVAALDLKLAIDHPIDERMHLIQSTKAAARFLKSHYLYFDSWLGALLAYNRGRAGAVRVFPAKYRGAKTVTLDDKTDQYILCVIATKIAFGKLAGKEKHSRLKLLVYNQGHHGQRLEDIAAYLKIDKQLLYDHNKWLRTTIIPHNTNCSLLVPFLHGHPAMHPVLKIPSKSKNVLLRQNKKLINRPSTQDIHQKSLVDYGKYLNFNQSFPDIISLKDLRSPRLIKANGILAIMAHKEDTLVDLAKLVNMNLNKFLIMNEIETTHQLRPNSVYYFGTKAGKGGAHYHVVASGEDLWGIAQKYGMKQSALLEKNRLKCVEPLEKGRILWLRFIRPRHIPVAYYDAGLILEAK